MIGSGPPPRRPRSVPVLKPGLPGADISGGMGEIAILNRYTADVGFDTRALARYVGSLDDGRSKVSVNSALSVGDRTDFFRLRMSAEGFARIRTGELVGQDGAGSEVAKEGTVRYQLRTASGRVIADSNPDAGAEHQAWLDLTSDANLKLGKGYYTLQVSRGPDALDRKDYIYAVTFRSGPQPVTDADTDRSIREFVTTERPAPPEPQFSQFGVVTSVLGAYVNSLVF